MAAGKNTGIQISLIICSVLMLIFGVVAYLMYKDLSETEADLAASLEEYDKADAARKNYLTQITNLQNLLGAQMENVGDAGSQDPNTVIGFVNTRMTELAGPTAQPTVVDTLATMRAEMNAKDIEIATLQSSENKINEEKVALTGVYNAKAESYNDNYKKAQQDLLALQTEKDETVAGYKSKLDAEQKKNTDLQIAYEKLQEELQDKIDDLDGQLSKVTKTNEFLTKEINDMRDASFDVPDGHIVSVHYGANNTVYIDLGSADNLRTGTTFSVYEKNLSTVGGRTSEIKASIEVIRIIDEHNAEATVLGDGKYSGDYSRPIARGDAIYSPLWRAGVQETFALIGTFDLDRDKSDDRNILINLIRNAGGDVKAQVTPDGERSGVDEITSQFKFLVLGDIGDPTKEPDEATRQMIQKVHSHTNDMKKEAQQSGVRVMTMNDFLSYIGYRPQRRLWRPGENIPWVMTTRRDGGRSRKDNISRGTVSGAYSRSNRDVETPR